MYIFHDWDDDDPSAELDIQGDHYKRLITLCFSYCHYFSLSENQFGKIDLPKGILKAFSEQQPALHSKKHVFFCSQEAKLFLLQKVNSFFPWLTLEQRKRGSEKVIHPEDLCFYRKDGSVFLWSETHEGICVICPKHKEDVSSIICFPGWHDLKDGEFFGVPANVEEYSLFRDE